MIAAITRHFERGIPEQVKILLVYVVSIAYAGINAYFIYKNLYYSLLLPFLLVLLWIYFNRLNIILMMIAALTPVAVNVIQFELGAGVSVPTEPLLFGVLLVFILRAFFGYRLDPAIWKQPITLVIIIHLVWMFITTLTSQIPLVSIKYFIARLWFIIPFFFLGIPLFRKQKNILLFIWLYTIPLVGVIFYTVYHHYLWGFDEEAGHWVMSPFYNDHTVYGAILALFVPLYTGFTFSRSYSRIYRFFSAIILAILMIALFLSYSRAAWISLALVTGVYLIVLFRIKFKWLAVAAIILGFIFYLFQNEIFDVLEKNKQGTSANFVEHVQSISNISTDASNLERINRWQSALRMYKERSVFGFGPGTYQFEYAPYQLSQEKTEISTNAGDRGNAHSEYIGPMSEQGTAGMLIMITLVGVVVITGMMVYKRTDNARIKSLSLSIMLGLLTYFLHGLLNNFLDTDKASVPVWAFIAMLVALKLYKEEMQG